ncbi:unnamed protein product [Durusdinium trenchii]|uniref:Uncharacterized protein n=1 Tax=Durusdinium trenchii TaxID=1381693 RepID=A0ABP0RL09_9DINO
MQSLCMKRASLVQDQGLFKAAKAWQVLSTLAWPRSFDLEVYSTLPTVGMVDIFISHSWSCPSWMKFLAMCQYLNLDFAIKASGLTCSLAITLLVFRAGGLSAVSQASQGWLYGSVVCGPIAVFLGTYFLGHTWRHESFWFDRVCVNQAELGEKARTLQGFETAVNVVCTLWWQMLTWIPAFVAHSQHMLVILDSSYFERLWCNYEVAVAAKTAKMVHLVPV